MSLGRWLYQVRNLPAHIRALRLGTTNTGGGVTYSGQLGGTVIRPTNSAKGVYVGNVWEMWRNWCDERGADPNVAASSADHARGILCGLGLLPADHFALGTLSRRSVTNAGVAFMADDFFDASKEITSYDFHDSGTGVVGENVTDTNLGTAAGPTTRATGTPSNPTAPVYRSVGTISYTTTLAITEHGIFDNATRGTDNLWDRSVFSAINVVNLDSIQFTYDLTITAGG